MRNMKLNRYTLFIYMLAGASLLAGCSDDMFNNGGAPGDSNRINLSGEIDQLAVTRVNDNGFAMVMSSVSTLWTTTAIRRARCS